MPYWFISTVEGIFQAFLSKPGIILSAYCYTLDIMQHYTKHFLLSINLASKVTICLQRVRLDFLNFTLPSCSDKLYIYEGRDATTPPIRTLCGSDLPENVTSIGNELFVHFESDSAERTRGFRIRYSSVGKECFYSWCFEYAPFIYLSRLLQRQMQVSVLKHLQLRQNIFVRCDDVLVVTFATYDVFVFACLFVW